jgi:hypothetical protein
VSWWAPARPGRAPPPCSPASRLLGDPARARPVPRQQEHVRRGRVPAHPRPAAPEVVGGGADPTVDHPTLHDGAHRHPGDDGRLPHRPHWGEPPYNGATAYRPDFDHWLAGKAEADGAQLVTSTTATGLLRDDAGRSSACAPTGPTATCTPGGDRVRRRQQLPREGGRACTARSTRRTTPSGSRRPSRCPSDVIDERFGVRDREGVDIEILGGTSGVNGGGFVYTNLDTWRGGGAEAPGARRAAAAARGDHRQPQGPPRRSRRSSRAARWSSTRPTSSPKPAGR